MVKNLKSVGMKGLQAGSLEKEHEPGLPFFAAIVKEGMVA